MGALMFKGQDVLRAALRTKDKDGRIMRAQIILGYCTRTNFIRRPETFQS